MVVEPKQDVIDKIGSSRLNNAWHIEALKVVEEDLSHQGTHDV